MKLRQLSFATITWARDAAEEQLLRTALERLAVLGRPVFITDGGSAPSFLQFLASFPNLHLLPPAKGLWTQAFSSLQGAYDSGSEAIFYTEPDKAGFFGSGLEQMLNAINTGGNTGIITAARSVEAFETFPPFQQMTETTINNCCAEVIGMKTDFTYGPFLMNRKLVPLLKELPADIGWGWRPFAFNTARRSGLEVLSYEGDFFCPENQRHDEPSERIYRMKQLVQNLQGLTLSTV